ncbi:MAG: biosynthetic-type acetolactate synthase large subunit [Verrucomicrobiota bacterium]
MGEEKQRDETMPENSLSTDSIRGAELAIRELEHAGVEVVFAYPGGASMELHQYLRESPVRVVLPRHEQGGAFAAGGYARACGRTGVCMATSGPGATNLVTGITDAYMDSVPLVVITGQVPHTFIGKNAFQETDIIGMTRPVCKHSYLVLDANEIPEVFAEAFYLANSGRPGPVVIDLPKDIQQAMCVPHPVEKPRFRGYQKVEEAADTDIRRIRDLIHAGERPCIYAGGGVIAADAQKELRQFAEEYNIPVATTLMGIGAIPENHPLSLKWLGMHGTYYANYAVNEADLLLTFGARFDDRVTGKVDTFAQHAKIVHVDIDPSEINKNKRVDLGLVADVKDVLTKLLEEPEYKDYSDWHARIRGWKENYPLTYKKRDLIQPQGVVECIYEETEGRATIVTGVGQHQMWSAQFYKFERPRQYITSGGLGAMGFGLPAAIGVKVATPEELVIDIDGDGSFQMNIQELGTVHTENIGVKMVVLNNQHLGMVAQWEDRFYGSKRGNTILRSHRSQRPYPDFAQIAKGYEIPAKEVWHLDELRGSIREMLDADGPFLLDVHVEYEEHVLPMIPSGGMHTDIMTE